MVAEAAVCDIYGYGKTPCVAAHSTTRALYDAYNGPLYQVKRAYDSATTDIKPLGPGRTANATIQDIFCAYTTCNITIIYDQSGHSNHLTQAPPGKTQGPNPGGYDNLASATAAPIIINGTKAYGLYIAPKTGYRQDKTSGIATYDQPEVIYEVIDGTHYGGCCFDYGNVEGNNMDNGEGHMETIYFGGTGGFNVGSGAGSGPWIMSDMENGIFSGQNYGMNANDPTINYRFTTAIVKGEPNHWQSGVLTLNLVVCTFYEGAMTSGYPSDNIEAYVQANIVNMNYKTSS